MISGQFTSQARPWLGLTKQGPAALPCAALRTRSSEDIDIVKVGRASGFAVGALDADVQKGLSSLDKGGCWFVAAATLSRNGESVRFGIRRVHCHREPFPGYGDGVFEIVFEEGVQGIATRVVYLYKCSERLGLRSCLNPLTNDISAWCHGHPTDDSSTEVTRGCCHFDFGPNTP